MDDNLPDINDKPQGLTKYSKANIAANLKPAQLKSLALTNEVLDYLTLVTIHLVSCKKDLCTFVWGRHFDEWLTPCMLMTSAE